MVLHGRTITITISRERLAIIVGDGSTIQSGHTVRSHEFSHDRSREVARLLVRLESAPITRDYMYARPIVTGRATFVRRWKL